MTNIFSLSWTNFKSAFVFAVLTAFVAVIVYILGLGDVFKIDGHTITNIGVMALLNGVLSLLKSFLTTDTGKFLGVTTVVPKTVGKAKAAVN